MKRRSTEPELSEDFEVTDVEFPMPSTVPLDITPDTIATMPPEPLGDPWGDGEEGSGLRMLVIDANGVGRIVDSSSDDDERDEPAGLVQWIDPPGSARGRGGNKWGAIVAELRSRPGHWALVETGVKGPPTGMARRYPNTTWTSRSQPDGTFKVWGKWTGTP